MRAAYKEALNIDLPRTSAEQELLGTNIDRADLQSGDLVFFRTRRVTPAELVERALVDRVRVAVAGPDRIRACLHLDVDDAGVERAIAAITRAVAA